MASGLTVEFEPVLLAADAFRRADRDMQRAIRTTANRTVGPLLKSSIARRARMGQDRTIAASARVRSGSNPAVVVPGGRFSGGLSVKQNAARIYEFGGYREAVVEYTNRSPRGTAYKVRRHTQRQIPWRTPKGRMIYPALAEVAPEIVGAWVRVVMAIYAEAARGEGR